jgi:2-keto-4-pentenoate hydratase/2-oxohepta-3-ene-1,7-dioic acid hydratase in catechol pathway
MLSWQACPSAIDAMLSSIDGEKREPTMSDFRLLTYQNGSQEAAGILVENTVYDAGLLAGDTSGSLLTMDVLARWDDFLSVFEQAAASPPEGGRPLADVVLKAPLRSPTNIFFAGANYWDHMREMAGFVKEMTGNEAPVEKQPEPWLTLKATASCVIGPSEEIRLPAFSNMVDWEAEVALVVGRQCKHLSAANALDCLAGYTIAHDVSARDFLKREGSPFIYDWLGQKSFDTSCPMGPWITPTKAITDPSDMSIKLWVNNVIKQDSNTNEIIHDFVEILVYLSGRLTLQPGDVILTGTPAGVGMPHGEFLQPGDTVKIEIGGLGELINPVIQGD